VELRVARSGVGRSNAACRPAARSLAQGINLPGEARRAGADVAGPAHPRHGHPCGRRLRGALVRPLGRAHPGAQKILGARAPHIGAIARSRARGDRRPRTDRRRGRCDHGRAGRPGDRGPLRPDPAPAAPDPLRVRPGGKPAITATQMLESMVASSRPRAPRRPTVAGAVWEGTDAVMLSEETSVGANPSSPSRRWPGSRTRRRRRCSSCRPSPSATPRRNRRRP